MDTNLTPQPTSWFQKLPPKIAFLAGVLSTLALFGVAAAIILGFMVFDDNDDEVNAAPKNSNAVTANANTNTVQAQPVLPKEKVDLTNLTNVRGTGEITIVEYSDTECPFCKRFHTSMQQIMKDFDGKVRWGYKHFPLVSLHTKATREAIATECAAEQGKFWEYIDKIFERTPSNDKLDDAELFTIATELKLDRKKFDECVNTEKYKDKVNQDSAEAQKLGAEGTPYSLIVDSTGKVLNVISGAMPVSSVQAMLGIIVK